MSGLKAMAAAGRIAERVLADLERDGFSDRSAYWIQRSKTSGVGLRRTSFPRAPDPSREDFPYAGMTLVAKNGFAEKYGSTVYRSLELWVDGHRPLPGGEFEKAEFKIGHVRFHKSKPTASVVSAPIVERDEELGIVEEHKWGGWIVRVGRQPKERDRLHLAHIAAFHVCGYSPTDPYVAELSRRLPRWLFEDGVTQRWLSRLSDMARKRSLVSQVLGG